MKSSAWLELLPRYLDARPIHPWPARTFHQEAGILVPIGVNPEGEAFLIFTRRSPHLAIHAGQIAFPGGQREGGETLKEAALREAWEEIGLPPEAVRVLGPLGKTFSPFGIAVQPFVGLVDLPRTFRPNEEVAEVLIFPLESLLSTRPRVVAWEVYGVVVPLFAYRVEGKTIWGMTGRVVADLLMRVRRAREDNSGGRVYNSPRRREAR